MRIRRSLPFVILALAACAPESTAPSAEDDRPGHGIVAGTLEASVVNGKVRLKNQTEHVVGYLVVDKNTAIVAMLPPCSGSGCKTLVQGGEAAISFTEIGGYVPGESREAIVYWWSYLPGPGGTTTVDRMNSSIIRL